MGIRLHCLHSVAVLCHYQIEKLVLLNHHTRKQPEFYCSSSIFQTPQAIFRAFFPSVFQKPRCHVPSNIQQLRQPRSPHAPVVGRWLLGIPFEEKSNSNVRKALKAKTYPSTLLRREEEISTILVQNKHSFEDFPMKSLQKGQSTPKRVTSRGSSVFPFFFTQKRPSLGVVPRNVAHGWLVSSTAKKWKHGWNNDAWLAGGVIHQTASSSFEQLVAYVQTPCPKHGLFVSALVCAWSVGRTQRHMGICRCW